MPYCRRGPGLIEDHLYTAVPASSSHTYHALESATNSYLPAPGTDSSRESGTLSEGSVEVPREGAGYRADDFEHSVQSTSKNHTIYRRMTSSVQRAQVTP